MGLLLLFGGGGGGGGPATGPGGIGSPIGLLLSLTKASGAATGPGGVGSPIGLLLALTKADGAAAPAARPPQAGGAFTRRPDRRLSLRDLQDYFSAEQEALDRAARAKRERERKAFEEAAEAVSRAMRAAVGADEGIEPELADIARKLEAAATAKRVNHAVRLANEAAAMAAQVEQEILLERARQDLWRAQEEDDEDAAFLLF